MSELVVTNNVTLDGVMQSPSHPDEDRRGGFEHGGWAPPYADQLMAIAPSPVVALNRAVTVAEVEGPERAFLERNRSELGAG